ncbi:MAG: type II toxin-antitoxin system ParD family antitoxin [Acidobacteria bacterium]|nr:type II toxin-antitoxin system ParD family antitoxin [Acidobacteriota bacterium]
MNVELTPDQRAFVQKAIESGRFKREEEAVEEALALWEERERRRLEILAMLDEADASLARGEGIPITEESMRALAEDVKQQGRRRLAAERKRATSR